MTLTDVLNGLRADDLKVAAKRLGLPKTLTRKAELVHAVKHYIETDLKGFLGHLGESSRWFLAEAAHHQGRVSPRVFAAKYKTEVPRGYFSFRPDTASLTELLTFQSEHTGELCLPGDLVQPLKALLPAPPEATIKTIDQLPAVLDLGANGPYCHEEQRLIHLFEGEKTAFAELRRVLTLVQTNKVRIQEKSRRPTDAAVRLLTAALVVPDFDVELPAEFRDKYTETAGPVRAHAWAVLVQQLGWAKPQGGVLALTKAGKELAGGVSPTAFRAGFERFLDDDAFDELNRVNHIRGQTGKAKRYMTRPSQRRGAICDSLADWPAGRWISFDEAFRFIDASGKELDVIDRPIWLYVAEAQYGSLGNAGNDIERQYLRVFLMESLATLGVVDIAYVHPQGLWPELDGAWGTDDLEFCGRYDGLLYVRLTSLGAFCLGGTDAYEPPAAERRSLLKVLPNRDLVVSGSAEATSADLATLELFAKKTGDHLWSLDPQRILGYVESGGSIEDLTRFLTENTEEPIPHTIEVFLGDLEKKLGAVRSTERAILVEMRDSESAARVAHDRQTKAFCRLAGDRHLAVPEKNEQAFRTAMKKLGYVVPR